MTLENEGICSAIAAVKTELSRPLLGRDDAEVALKIEDPNDRLATLICSRYDQVEISSVEKLRRHIGKLQIVELWQLTSNSPEDLIVEIPRLVNITNISRLSVSEAPLPGFLKITAESLRK